MVGIHWESTRSEPFASSATRAPSNRHLQSIKSGFADGTEVALPSEAPHASTINDLGDVLGEVPPIEFQHVSAAAPKPPERATSGTFAVSAELAASIGRMKARSWLDKDAQAFEQGAIPTKPAAKPTARNVKASRVVPRQRPRSPDRQASRDRRRRLGGSSALPDTLRHHYTEGQRAVLCIIAGEVKHHGICDLPIDRIAALAGVCRTLVQTTLHEARRLGHLKVTERPMRGRKSLTNLVAIVSPEWRTWIKRGPSAHRPIGSKSVNLVSTTKSKDSFIERAGQVEKSKGAWQGAQVALSVSENHDSRSGSHKGGPPRPWAKSHRQQ